MANPRPSPHTPPPLWMPPGSVRSILALSLVAALIYGVWRFSDSRYAPQSSRRRRGVRLS